MRNDSFYLRQFANSIHRICDEHEEYDELIKTSEKLQECVKIFLNSNLSKSMVLGEAENILTNWDDCNEGYRYSVEMTVHAMHVYAHTVSTDFVQLIHKSLERLSEFFQYKAKAFNCRKRGNIRIAEVHEKHCEKIFSELPYVFKW